MSRSYREYADRKRHEFGDRFSDVDLHPQFRSWYETQQRIEVTTTYEDGSTYVRRGRVGVTTGWKPAWILMHRSSDHGSGDVLGAEDQVTGVQRGRGYEPHDPTTDAYGYTVGHDREEAR